MADNNKRPSDNFISKINEKWHDLVPSPALRSLLYGTAAYAASRKLWNPLIDTIKVIGKPLRLFTGLSSADWDRAMEAARHNSDVKRKLPWIIGGLTFATPLALNYRTTYELDQLWSDNPTTRVYSPNKYVPSVEGLKEEEEESGIEKQSGLFDIDGYESNIDFSKHINTPSALSMFTNDPYLAKQDYTRNLGVSIIADANNKSPGRLTTLGDIFDSAASKIDTKLSMNGLISTGVKAVVSNGLSKLFTTAIGTVVDLDDSTKQTLINTGTWAGTISAILE